MSSTCSECCSTVVYPDPLHQTSCCVRSFCEPCEKLFLQLDNLPSSRCSSCVSELKQQRILRQPQLAQLIAEASLPSSIPPNNTHQSCDRCEIQSEELFYCVTCTKGMSFLPQSFALCKSCTETIHSSSTQFAKHEICPIPLSRLLSSQPPNEAIKCANHPQEIARKICSFEKIAMCDVCANLHRKSCSGNTLLIDLVERDVKQKFSTLQRTSEQTLWEMNSSLEEHRRGIEVLMQRVENSKKEVALTMKHLVERIQMKEKRIIDAIEREVLEKSMQFSQTDLALLKRLNEHSVLDRALKIISNKPADLLISLFYPLQQLVEESKVKYRPASVHDLPKNLFNKPAIESELISLIERSIDALDFLAVSKDRRKDTVSCSSTDSLKSNFTAVESRSDEFINSSRNITMNNSGVGVDSKETNVLVQSAFIRKGKQPQQLQGSNFSISPERINRQPKEYFDQNNVFDRLRDSMLDLLPDSFQCDKQTSTSASQLHALISHDNISSQPSSSSLTASSLLQTANSKIKQTSSSLYQFHGLEVSSEILPLSPNRMAIDQSSSSINSSQSSSKQLNSEVQTRLMVQQQQNLVNPLHQTSPTHKASSLQQQIKSLRKSTSGISDFADAAIAKQGDTPALRKSIDRSSSKTPQIAADKTTNRALPLFDRSASKQQQQTIPFNSSATKQKSLGREPSRNARPQQINREGTPVKRSVSSTKKPVISDIEVDGGGSQTKQSTRVSVSRPQSTRATSRSVHDALQQFNDIHGDHLAEILKNPYVKRVITSTASTSTSIRV